MAKSTVISPRPAGWSRGSRLPLISPVAVVLLGVVLLTLGLPRLVSALILLPSEPVSDSLRVGRTVDPAAISALQRRSSLARRFSSSGRIAAELGAAKIAEAELLPASAVRERFRLADEAALLLEQGLERAPANSFAWSRLAYARVIRDGPSAKAAEAWRMSVLTAPADRRLAPWRARFGIVLLPTLDEEDRELLDRQIRLAWQYGPRELARFAKNAGPETINLVRAALLGNPEDLKTLDELLK